VIVAADTGGTFTDFVVVGRGRIRAFKRPSTPQDPSAALLGGIQIEQIPGGIASEQTLGGNASEQIPSGSAIETITGGNASEQIPGGTAIGEGGAFELLHGTTVATNAILERKMAKTAFITNDGFQDLLFLARQTRPKLYELEPVLPKPPVARGDCYGVPGRLLPDGAELEPLNLDPLPNLSGFEAIAVCLLFSYANPDHELRVAEWLREVAAQWTRHGHVAADGAGQEADHAGRDGPQAGDQSTGPFLSLSHQVSPEFREYERAVATTLNAAVGPLMSRYIENIRKGIRGGASIMSSAGGLISLESAIRFPIKTVTSGPAAGVVAAKTLMEAHGRNHAVAFDMGGTSTDVALIDGEPAYTSLSEIAGLPVRQHGVDIHTIGCGGGSIAHVDSAGALRVGPESAGATPGPALYGNGGPMTVTDANVVLGRLPLARFAGGGLHLDAQASHTAAEKLSEALNHTPWEVAEAIVASAEAQMGAAIRKVTSSRGFDPADFALIAYGGSGGLHACAVAQELGMKEVLIPTKPGVFSALGLLHAPMLWEESRTVLGGDQDWEAVYASLAAGFPTSSGVTKRFAEMRYKGQSHEIEIEVLGSREEAEASFAAEHARRLGVRFEGKPVEWVSARVRVEVFRELGALSHESKPPPPIPPSSPIVVDGKRVTARLVNREDLPPGAQIAGPVIVLADDGTIYLPLGWHGEALPDATLRLYRP
jgi:N-methylhydantoinase A